MKLYTPIPLTAAAHIERLFHLAGKLNAYVSACGGEPSRVARELAAICQEAEAAAADLPPGTAPPAQ